MSIKKDLMTLEELREYLPDKPKPTTIYRYVCDGVIPYYKFGKKLFFSKSEIDQWNEKGRRKAYGKKAIIQPV